MDEAADFAVSIVILSERSLPALAGESKDLYLPRLARLIAQTEARSWWIQ